MNNSSRSNAQSGDQYALSLLVNAAEGRDASRQRTGSEQRYGDQAFNVRSLGGGSSGFGGSDASLEEQLLLQQQAFGGGSSGAILNQLREQSLLSQLNQQHQLAALLGLGGGGNVGGGNGGSWNPSGPEIRQALAAAQLRQKQAASQLTQADILALSRAGALPGLFGSSNSGALSGYGGTASGTGSYRTPGVGGYGGTNSADLTGSQSFAAELEGLQRLEELNRRKRLLAANVDGPRSNVDRGVAVSQGITRDVSQMTSTPSRIDPSRKLKSDTTRNGDQTKDEMTKLPGSVIVPCRARGMPMDHNFKTAYFVIPEDVKHGEELICSYFACRNAGIKFRYCSHCKVPVAKRNFRKRHKHGGEIVGDKGDDSGDDDTPTKGIPSQITAGREEEVEDDGISSQSVDSSNDQDDEKCVPVSTDRVATFKDKASKHKDLKSTEQDFIHHKISDERKAHWISLLSKRPSTKDSDTMSGWLMEVLAVSDLETPLPTSSDENQDDRKNDDEVLNDEVAPTAVKVEETEKELKDTTEKDMIVMDDNADEDTDEELNDDLLRNKKRPMNMTDEDKVVNESNNDTKQEKFVSGSFAEWKERKKLKMQSKVANGVANSGGTSSDSQTAS